MIQFVIAPQPEKTSPGRVLPLSGLPYFSGLRR